MIAHHDGRELIEGFRYFDLEDIDEWLDIEFAMRALSGTQRSIVSLLVAGYTYVEIAQRLNISADVVRVLAESAGAYIDSPWLTSLILHESLLSELPEPRQTIVRLRLRGYTLREIGRELGVSHTYVSRRLHYE